jgi:NTE family protein
MQEESPALRRAYVAFEGGGAKGVAHVGAYEKIIQSYDCRGFAGTSAGSLMAALAASGFTPDEIFDISTKKTIVSNVKGAKGALDLFDAWSGQKLKFVIALHRFLVNTEKIGVLKYSLLTFSTISLILASLFYGLWPSIYATIYFILIVPTLVLFSIYFVLRCGGGGIASLDVFEENLRKILARQVLGSESECLRFCHFGPDSGRPSLKMVATNLSTGSIELFSPETTPLVSVSAAVTASICIPLIFKPRRIHISGEGGTSGIFFDGGLVSNQPAWTFDDERRIDAEAATILVGISDKGHIPPSNVISWVMRFLRTAIFGSHALNQRNIGHAIDIPVFSERVGLLDFDATFSDIAEVIESSKRIAEARISADRMFDQLVEDAHKIFLEEVLASSSSHSRNPRIRIRCSIADVTSAVKKWRCAMISSDGVKDWALISKPEFPIVFRSQKGFEGCTDRWLPISPRSVCGFILQEISRSSDDGCAAYFSMEQSEGGNVFLDTPQDEMARTLVEKDISWVLACGIRVPKSDELNLPERHYILAVDGNQPISDENGDLPDFVGAFCDRMVTLTREWFASAAETRR